MASEIQLRVGLLCNKSGTKVQGDLTKVIDMTGTGQLANVQNIGTSSEALVLGDVSTIGYLYLKNLDPTNYVAVGIVNPAVAGDCPITLLPGEACVVPTRKTGWYAIADTAACDLAVVACEL